MGQKLITFIFCFAPKRIWLDEIFRLFCLTAVIDFCFCNEKFYDRNHSLSLSSLSNTHTLDDETEKKLQVIHQKFDIWSKIDKFSKLVMKNLSFWLVKFCFLSYPLRMHFKNFFKVFRTKIFKRETFAVCLHFGRKKD